MVRAAKTPMACVSNEFVTALTSKGMTGYIHNSRRWHLQTELRGTLDFGLWTLGC